MLLRGRASPGGQEPNARSVPQMRLVRRPALQSKGGHHWPQIWAVGRTEIPASVGSRCPVLVLPLRLRAEAFALYLKQERMCALSGVPIVLAQSDKAFKGLVGTASLDRIDSARGYHHDNVQWVHKHINRMKGPLPDPDFIEYCRHVALRWPA